MKDIIYVSGHKNPDADSICSAISYAYLKNHIDDGKTYVPIRLDNINDETKFILNYFNIEDPIFMETIRLKVSDLEYSDVPSLNPGVSIAKASKHFIDNNIDYISVADSNNRLCGMLTSSSLNKIYTDIWHDNILFESKTTIENIIETLEANTQYINKDVKYFKGKILISAMSESKMKEFTSKDDIVIVGDREDIIESLIDIGVSLIITTGGYKISDCLLYKVKEKGITVINVNGDSFSVSKSLLQSIPISYVMASDNLNVLSLDDLVKDVKGITLKTRHRAYPIVDEDNNVMGIISRYGLLSKGKKRLIQVDHNEYAQSIDGVEEAEIIEVIDHHRVADIQTSYPIFFRNEPVGSTSTIVASIYFEKGAKIPKSIAGLLMSGILSDTLLFKSPTCTKIDIDMCYKLAEIAGVSDISAYAYEMQKAATSLEGKNVCDIFNSDFKEFKFGKIKVGISQMNTLDIDSFNKIKDDMLEYMNNKLNSENYDIILLTLTDIIAEGSLFVAVGDTNIVEKSFNIKLEDGKAYVPGILSRKKQIVPAFSKHLEMDQF
jgi:manganese-dependent inorganic pyrophosphatase